MKELFLPYLLGMKELFFQYFPGMADIANIHPIIVHFPIALLSGFLVAEILGLLSGSKDLRTAAKWMLYFGTLGALVAASVGLLSAEGVYHEGEVHFYMLKHRDYGLNVAALSVVLTTWRLVEGRDFVGISRLIQNLVGILIVVNLMLGSDIGGAMVYRYGVAVDAVARERNEEIVSHAHSDDVNDEIMDWWYGILEGGHDIRMHIHCLDLYSSLLEEPELASDCTDFPGEVQVFDREKPPEEG